MALALVVVFIASIVAFVVVAAVRAQRPATRRVLLVLLALCAVPLLVALGASFAHVANNLRLARFSAQLFDYPVPPGAREVGRRAEVGVLTGNGNHCDFRAESELDTQLSLEAVRAHYAALHLRPAITGGLAEDMPSLDVVPRAHGGYVIRIVDAPYEAGLDLRCH